MRNDKPKTVLSAFVKNLATLVITGIILLITAYLTYKSFIGTADMNVAGSMLEQLLFEKDNIFLNIALSAALIALIFLFLKLTKKAKPAFFTVGLLFLTFTLGVLWCYFSSTVPTNDSRFVVSAAFEASWGAYERFTQNYLQNYFPFQTGYVFITEIFVRFFNLEYGNFVPLQMINVAFLCISYFALLRITDKAFKSGSVHKLTCLLLALSLPPVFFTTFLYGNLIGLGFALLSVWQMLCFLEKDRIICGILSAILIGAATLVKLNYAIVLVAEIIIVALNLLTVKGSKVRTMLAAGAKKLAYIALSVLMVIGMQRAVFNMYESRCGEEFGEGIPMISWAAMGLSEAYIEAGWYEQDHTVRNYLDNDMDNSKATEGSLKHIKTRLARFAEHPSYALDFFDRKISSQWNETTYQSLWTNEVRLRAEGIHPISLFVLYDCDGILTGIMDYHAQIVFLGALVATLFLLKKRNNASTILMLIIIGGFLYHAIFEAKSQYILPYFIMMIPLAAYGFYSLFKIAINLKNKKQG